MNNQKSTSPHESSIIALDLAAIATNRFGLGAKEGEIEQAKSHPKKWLLTQLEYKPAVYFNTNLPDSKQVITDFSVYQKSQKSYKKQVKKIAAAALLHPNNPDPQKPKKPKKPHPYFYRAFSQDTIKRAIHSSNSLNWRLLDFFSNHFSVTAKGGLMVGLAGTLEREAIAPNLLGNFEDMLIAVSKHPSMLIYLNNERSVGPDSQFSQKKKFDKRSKGLNENLAREILELHTLGVNAGYSQQDVTELAKGITGWTVQKSNKHNLLVKQGSYVFKSNKHQPGTRLLLKTHFKDDGEKQGESMLKYLANHPKTAQHMCTKLAAHFIQDSPTPELVNDLVAHWKHSKGNIKVVMQALINHPLAWQATPQKYKTPREFVISTYRLLNNKKKDKIYFSKIRYALSNMGQVPFKAGSPAGYSDDQKEWNGSHALITRIEWISKILGEYQVDALSLQKTALGEAISPHSKQMIKRAESQQQAATLLLLSPEFLRR